MKRYTFIIILIALASVSLISAKVSHAASTPSDFSSGYNEGCKDSALNHNDRQVQDPSGYTKDFIDGYSSGFEICSGLDPDNFNCGEGSDGCQNLPYCSKIDSDIIGCYDEIDTED